jgi:light-regulated signal transduction histidine kinase (bacteriophytochrome)
VSPRDELAARYRSALARWLTSPDEESLIEAYEVGRGALGQDLGVLDVAAAHQDALAAELADAPADRAGQLAANARELFEQALAPYEIALRGYRETNRVLESARADLERRVEQRTEDIRQLNAELERRVAERTAQLDGANRELEAFSYSVAHDLRAPLRHIDGFATMLKKRADAMLDETGRRYLDTIGESAKRLGTLIDELLVFSRMSRAPLNRARVDMNALVDEVVAGLAPSLTGRNVRWVRSPLPDVQGDGPMLRQVFVNLVANAVKFTGKRAEAVIEIRAERTGPDAVFTVADNGVGFDMAYADKLFGVFQRLHTQQDFEGTGIGLANVARIVARHGGRVWAEAELDRGARFHVSLPVEAKGEVTGGRHA